jgi:hypothetical protein
MGLGGCDELSQKDDRGFVPGNSNHIPMLNGRKCANQGDQRRGENGGDQVEYPCGTMNLDITYMT